MTSAWRFAILTFLGILLAQAAWILAVPPYRAIDEFDHVYRSASVARGQWLATTPAEDGRGVQVVVPEDIVEAASAQCADLPYTGPDNCFPVDQRADGLVTIAAATGPYNPLYYWATGTVARPFDGAHADYAMRMFSALVCALFVAAAAYCLVLAGGRQWTRFAFLASLTPVLIYTTVIPAPNSWEIVAGLLVWTSLLAAAGLPPGDARVPWLILASAVAGCVLVTPRALGPMWCGLIVLVLLVFSGRERTVRLVRERRWAVVGATVAVSLATLAGAWWTVSAGWVGASGDGQVAADADAAMSPVRWIVGTVAAFPYRNQLAPLPIYPLYFLVVGALLWFGVRHARRREQVAILGATGLTVLVPMVLTYLTAESRGAMWQGRYGLAFIVGILPLCGLILDRVEWAPRERARLLPLGLVMLAIGQVWSVAHVARDETRNPVSAADPSWITLPPVVIGLLAAAGFVLLAVESLRVETRNAPASAIVRIRA